MGAIKLAVFHKVIAFGILTIISSTMEQLKAIAQLLHLAMSLHVQDHVFGKKDVMEIVLSNRIVFCVQI
jgi:hypothetical protein